jgi:hypothetical protein
MATPLVCPNGHAMDDGLLTCPACGVYRRPRSVRPDETIAEYIAREFPGVPSMVTLCEGRHPWNDDEP